MKKHIVVIAGLIASMSTAAHAQVTTDLAQTPPGKYVMDASHSNVLFEISHLGFSDYVGRFNKIDGALTFDPKAAGKGTVAITIDAASIDTNNQILQDKLKAADAFNVAKFPTITFTAKGVEAISGNKGKLTGDLTMMGVTKPVTLNVTFNGGALAPFSKKYTLGFHGEGVMTRSAWGLNNWLPLVGDQVKLIVRAEFIKAE